MPLSLEEITHPEEPTATPPDASSPDASSPDGTPPAPPAPPGPTMCIPDLVGEPYVNILKRMHDVLRPANYLEVGCFTGDTLGLASCSTIGVDPSFRLSGNWHGTKPACMLFQMGSDAFFKSQSPTVLFGGPIEMAFLDGLHLWEVLLRDFIHTERHCKRNSVVFMHDCLPVDVTIADREMNSVRRGAGPHPYWWTGDVWKALVALKAARPDLAITAWDAQPTGLIGITNLDPASTVLSDSYSAIVRAFADTTLDDYGIERFFAEVDVKSTSALSDQHGISSYYWL